MKFDKETLLKQHFWVLLIVFVPLELVMLFGLFSEVAGAQDASKTAIKTAQDKLKAKSIKGRDYIAALQAQETTLLQQQQKLWGESWKEQEDIFTWPWPDQAKDLGAKYFGDPIDPDVRGRFRRTDVYEAMYKALPATVKPTQIVNGWANQNVLRHVDRWEDKEATPSDEDIWLAMEDYWVQRELLRTIHAANQAAVRFEPAPAADQSKPEKGVYRAKFRSRIWELDLALTEKRTGTESKPVFRGTLKNLSGQRQTLGADGKMEISVKIRKSGTERERIPIEAEYVPAFDPNQKGQGIVAFEFEPKSPGSVFQRADGLYEPEQVLTLRTVPVKRIDQIALGYNSSRTDRQELKKASFSQKLYDEASRSATPVTGPGPGPGPGPGVPPTVPTPPPPPPGREGERPGAGVASPYRSQSGLDRSRYVNTTPQVRRMPVGVLLVVDQAYVQDVLVAFANSKLRFQETQYQFRRFRDAIAEETPTGKPDQPVDPVRPPRRPPRPGAEGGPFPPPGGVLQNTEDQLPAAVVQLEIYGIASLYERYPPKGAPGIVTTPPGPRPTRPGRP